MILFFNLLYNIEEILLYNFLLLLPDRYEPIKTYLVLYLRIFVVHDKFSFHF